jgi:hypothetical protein
MLLSAGNKRNGRIGLLDLINKLSLSEGKVKVAEGGVIYVQSHQSHCEQKWRRGNGEVVGGGLHFVGGLGAPSNDVAIQCLDGHAGEEHCEDGEDGH